MNNGNNSVPVSNFRHLSGESLPSPAALAGRGRSRRGGNGNWRFGNRFRPYGRGRGSSGGGRGYSFSGNRGQEPRRGGGRGRGASPNSNRGNHTDINPGSNYSSIATLPRRQPTISDELTNSLVKKYPGYRLYFSSAPGILNPWEKLEHASEHLKRNEELTTSIEKLKDIEEQEYFDIFYDLLLQDLPFMKRWPNFPVELVEEPEDVLNIFGLALHKIVFDALNADEVENSKNDSYGPMENNLKHNEILVPHIRIRLLKLDPITPLRSIKSSLLGKFITVRGAVVRTGNARPYCTRMTYSCSDCYGTFSVQLPDGQHVMPSRCQANFDCQGKSFEAVETAVTSKLIDAKRIRLQDVQYSDTERGSVPRTVDCILYNNMAELCSAGDAVTICGIVKMKKESNSYASSDRSLHNCYLEAVALRNHKDSERTIGGNYFSFTNKDYYAVKEIHDTDRLFRLLVNSLCPTIYGNEIVKAGLILSLFGGTPSYADPIISRRSEINVLIVGDPGLGKSQILNVVSEVAPRGVYVCGTSSTVAGLTVTMVKDGDDYSLEAGALVMADRGICCIDEFDKMQSQHHALLEAMEQQSISVAKSGVFRTLAARTAVVAAANPVGGHYDKTKTVSENIRISPPLLSRFDLTFVLLDTPNEERDRNIVHHVMGLRGAAYSHQPTGSSQCSTSSQRATNMPLIERLKFDPNEPADLIPHHLIRKYIAYAKLYVKPVLTDEAGSVIKDYYLKLRMKHRLIDSTPVTTRQLESLVRLTQARAKLELREVATSDDAKDALEIFEFGLSGVFDNDSTVSTVLAEISSHALMTPSSRTGTRNQAKKLVSNLQRLSEQQCKNIFTMDELKQIGRAMGISCGMENLISSLNNEGLLLHKGGRIYQLQSCDF